MATARLLGSLGPWVLISQGPGHVERRGPIGSQDRAQDPNGRMQAVYESRLWQRWAGEETSSRAGHPGGGWSRSGEAGGRAAGATGEFHTAKPFAHAATPDVTRPCRACFSRRPLLLLQMCHSATEISAARTQPRRRCALAHYIAPAWTLVGSSDSRSPRPGSRVARPSPTAFRTAPPPPPVRSNPKI